MIDSKKLTRWYDFQAPFYRLWRNRYDGPLVKQVLAFLGRGASEDLLDAGCGTGLFSIGIALHGEPRRIEGIDASEGMLAVARREANARGLDRLRYRQGDVGRLPFSDAEFDVVVSAGLIPCLNRPELALGEFRRVLRPGGRLISVEFDRESMGLLQRIFFLTLMSGFKLFAALQPKFRYAKRWNLEASTIDTAAYQTQIASAGFGLLDVVRCEGHILYHASREDA